MQMKYAILVGDGMADFAIPELGGKTPLEYANTPNMDLIAREGIVGRVATVPDGLPAGSDVANLSLMGYDPAQFYSGRAPIEAASMGVALSPSDTAFRCNLITIRNGLMEDYSAGHIESGDAYELISLLDARLGNVSIRFHPGVSYRHLLVIADFPGEGCICTPPHDISGRPAKPHLPSGPDGAILQSLMKRAHEVLRDASVNVRRTAAGKAPATDIWLWGQGRAVTLPLLSERYGLSGSVISAVDLVRGLGVLAGLKIRLVEGATGYLGTNYAGKFAAAAAALDKEDFVYLHIEAPDETSHEGSLQKKIIAIEEFDKHIVGEMRRYWEIHENLRVLVAPDHATPISLKTHHAAPVPFAACGPGILPDETLTYGESVAQAKPVCTGPALFKSLITGVFGS